MDPYTIERPFHLVVVFWGRSYGQTFLDYCVASLLSPSNLPALSTRQRSKFLIATRPADWEFIRASPMFEKLSQYVDPVFIEIPPCPPGVSGCVHMGVGHKIACQMALSDHGYLMILTPDCMLSDGTLRNLQEHARKGIQLVWVAALRFAQEPFLAHLRSWGLLPDAPGYQTGQAVSISGADMVRAGINSLHSETASYEWVASYFPHIPSAVWWRVPGENGMVVYSLSWAPLLLDTAAINAHDTTALESWTIDGDYVFRNLGASPRMHVVQDSDECFISSWGPIDDRPISLAPRYLSSVRFFNFVAKAREFRLAYYGPYFDPLKRKVFLQPVRWHSYGLNRRWRAVERKSRRTLRLVIGTSIPAYSLNTIAFVATPIIRGKEVARRCRIIAADVGANREVVMRRLKHLGNRKDRTRVLWRLRQAVIFVTSGHVLPDPSQERKPVL
jgi:hypothetical protein